MNRVSRYAELEETEEVLNKEGSFERERFLEKFWSKHKARTIIGGLGLLFIGGGLLLSLILASQQPSQVEIISSEEEVEKREIFVDVAGAVEKPGVYQLERGARVNDVLIAAGGLSASADREWVAKNLNLASKIKDGAKIYIKFLKEKQTSFVSPNQNSPQVAGIAIVGDKININNASVSELDKLPGIGPALAQRIIDYRFQNGSYSNIEDLLKVSGIGEKLFSKIKDRVTLW